jgi:hypothetical protein
MSNVFSFIEHCVAAAAVYFHHTHGCPVELPHWNTHSCRWFCRSTSRPE